MTNITEWRQRQVVGEIKEFLATNMEAAAGVVEIDARRRLASITGEPHWGRNYRRLLAFSKLISQVVTDGDVVEGQIGIPVGEFSRGGSCSDYGFWVEVGTQKYPPHPWLRPALVNNFREILRLLTGG